MIINRSNRRTPYKALRASTAGLILAVASIAGVLWAQPPAGAETAGGAGQGSRRAGQAGPAAADLAAIAGPEVLRQAVLRLEQYGGIGARVRYRVGLFNQELIGSGNYYQGPPGSRHSRMELKLQAANKTCSHLQVCDGQTLWTFEQYPESRKLTRVNVDEVLAALAKGPATPSPLGLGIGGLPELLRRLNQSFEFTAPTAGKLGQWPVLRLEGKWSPAMLALLLPEQKEAIEAGQAADLSKLADQAPHQVVLYLGQNDLFPYRLEFDRGEAAKPEQPMLVMEFFEVQFNLAVDPERFTYKPSYRKVEDITASYIEQLK